VLFSFPAPAHKVYKFKRFSDIKYRLNFDNTMSRFFQVVILTFILLCGSSFSVMENPQVRSVLAEGEIYKISVDRAGIFKMDYAFLKNELGIAIDQKDPRNIRLYGFGGGMLPETIKNGVDLEMPEIPISVHGEGDGKFDANDYILFYSPGPDQSYWDPADSMFLVRRNLYSRSAVFFLKMGNGPGLRMAAPAPFPTVSTDTLDAFLDLAHFEEEKTNLLAGRTSTYGSGKNWYGDYFKTLRKKDYSGQFDLSGGIVNSRIKTKIGFAARSDVYTTAILQFYQSKFEIRLNPTNTADVEDDVARETKTTFSLPYQNQPANLVLDYPATVSPSEGWLDFISINVWKPLNFDGSPVIAYHPGNPGGQSVFRIETQKTGFEVWEVLDSNLPKRLALESRPEGAYFPGKPGGTPGIYVLFDPAGNLPRPNRLGKIPNQNLAALSGAKSVILYHPDFKEAAEKLAAHRASFSGISTEAIAVDEVFNEFGSGQADPTALRNFARHLYLNDPTFEYLTLFGDGSYDYLGLNKELAKNENFIPVFETEESLSPLYAFPSDDYFGLLEEGEGGPDLTGDLDIGVGRIPVRSKEEAGILVDKIIHYDTHSDTYGDWKLRVAFSADDEDANIHLEQTESISNQLQASQPLLNLQKIYLDAFKQEAGSGGELIPGANQSLNQNIFQGLLVFNYLGHGGPKGLSQEGLLRNTDVEVWSNKSRLPLVITATCSFAPYDDPAVPSTGEALFRSPYGGAIALLTTVRNVYSSSNEILTRAVFEQLFVRQADGKPQTLGEVMKKAKNRISGNGFDRLNARKFALLGDPAQHLSLPALQVKTTAINGKRVQEGDLDTIRSLQLLSVQGEITDAANRLLSGFNGTVSVTLFDKKSTVKTLGQNSDSYPKSFQVQNSILFKGNARVENGRFEIRFVVPKDINYTFGPAKLSYYASSGEGLEASGYFDRLIAGGSLAQLSDQEAPLVRPYINHPGFRDGGKTHPDPLLLVDLYDENGINATGNSIGHDLVAILDRDSRKQYVLNAFYESAEGDYKRGLVTFPFSDLSPGFHHLEIIAWDVANNSGRGEITFEVTDPAAGGHILDIQAVPNPAQGSFRLLLVHDLQDLNEAKLKLQVLDYTGRVLFGKEEVLSPSPVIYWSHGFDSGLPAGLYLIQAEIWSGGRRVDVRGTKVLRIP